MVNGVTDGLIHPLIIVNRDKHQDGLIEFVRKGFIIKRMKEYETKLSKTICTEFTVSKRK